MRYEKGDIFREIIRYGAARTKIHYYKITTITNTTPPLYGLTACTKLGKEHKKTFIKDATYLSTLTCTGYCAPGTKTNIDRSNDKERNIANLRLRLIEISRKIDMLRETRNNIIDTLTILTGNPADGIKAMTNAEHNKLHDYDWRY